MAVDLNPIPGYNKDGEDSVWAFRNSQSGVKQLLAGSGITLSPASGLGAVTVTASGGGAVASVTADPAGVGLTTIPTTGVVVVKNTQPASTWSTYMATSVAALNDYLLALRANTDLFHYLKFSSTANGPELGGYGGGRLVSTAGATPTVVPALTWTGANVLGGGNIGVPNGGRFDVNQNLGYQYIAIDTVNNGVAVVGYSGGSLTNSNGSGDALTWLNRDVTLGRNVTLNPGGSLLAPFLLGGRNYLDINAPAPVGSTRGALRLQGYTVGDGNIVIADHITLTPPTSGEIQAIGLLSCRQVNIIPGYDFYRGLGSAYVLQPIIQYGTATGSGATGTVVVIIPTAYTSATSYVVQVTMQDSPTAELYATPTLANEFKIGWTSAGVGTQNIMWTTFGT